MVTGVCIRTGSFFVCRCRGGLEPYYLSLCDKNEWRPPIGTNLFLPTDVNIFNLDVCQCSAFLHRGPIHYTKIVSLYFLLVVDEANVHIFKRKPRKSIMDPTWGFGPILELLWLPKSYLLSHLCRTQGGERTLGTSLNGTMCKLQFLARPAAATLACVARCNRIAATFLSCASVSCLDLGCPFKVVFAETNEWDYRGPQKWGCCSGYNMAWGCQ